MRDAAIADISLQTKGRFNDAPTVTGATPSQQWPRIPSGPWAEPAELPGVEPPTGIDINAQEAVGEMFEQEASIQAELARASSPASSSGEDASTTTPDILAPVSERGTGATVSTEMVAPTIHRRRFT
jgi:hypothetical protein